MFGLTQQERRIIQLLLISLLVGLAVTFYKRSHFGSDWQNSEIYKSEFEKIQHASKTRSKDNYLKNTTNADTLSTSAAKSENATPKSLAQFGAKLNVNNATAEELESLPGIGPSLAKMIIQYREQYGQFKSIDGLKNVKGIGEKKLENIRNLISIQ